MLNESEEMSSSELQKCRNCWYYEKGRCKHKGRKTLIDSSCEDFHQHIELTPESDSGEMEKIRNHYLDYICRKNKEWDAASEMLARYIQSKRHIYTTKDDLKNEMWIYKDGIYIPQGKSEIKQLLREVLKDNYNSYIYNLVIAKIEPDTFINSDVFFKMSYPNEIPVLNGILNIKTKELSDYNPEKIYFNKMPVKYNPNLDCPKIDSFLSDILKSPDDKQIFYELVGFGLLDEYKFEKSFMFHGDGRNGKGKSIELIKRLFGIENCCSVPLVALKADDFSIAELFGKRFNLAGDIGNQDLKETNMFKSLTGRDLISAKRKFLNNLHFQNNAKFVFACNELPMVYDLSKGFWDRWVLLDFPYTFITQEEYNKSIDKINLKIRDDGIIDKISTPEELSGLLNEALNALDNIKKQKRFSTTMGSEDIKFIWIRKSNSAIAFCWDNIEDDYNGRISKKEFRKRYVEYCRTHKIVPKSDFIIKKVLQENFGVSEIKGQYFEEIHAVRDDSWEGIKWKEVTFTNKNMVTNRTNSQIDPYRRGSNLPIEVKKPVSPVVQNNFIYKIEKVS